MFLSLAEAFINFPWMSNYQVVIDFFGASIDFLIIKQVKGLLRQELISDVLNTRKVVKIGISQYNVGVW